MALLVWHYKGGCFSLSTTAKKAMQAVDQLRLHRAADRVSLIINRDADYFMRGLTSEVVY